MNKNFGSKTYLKMRDKTLIDKSNLITFDTETDDLNGKLLALTATARVEKCELNDLGEPSFSFPIETVYYCGPGMIERFFGGLFHKLPYSHDYYVYAHNAQYDWRYLFDFIADFKSTGVIDELKIIARTSSDILSFSFIYRGCTFHFMDSLAIAPMSLEKFTKQMSPEIKKLSGTIDFDNGEKFDPQNPEHIAYARQDALSLWYSLINYQNLLKSIFNVNIQTTSAGTAMMAWEKTLGKNIPYDKDIKDKTFLDACQQAYYGGAVFLTTTKKQKNLVTFDINSSYPAVMESVQFPDDRYLSIFNKNQILPSSKFCQIIFAYIETPDNIRIPIIPTRRRKDKGAIIWPKGKFYTMTTNVELELAIKHGYKAEVLLSWCAPLVSSPFKKLVKLCKQTRYKYKDGPLETVAKLIQNSLYGKFATNPVRTVVDTESVTFYEENKKNMTDDEKIRYVIDNNINGDFPFSFKQEDMGEEVRRKIIYAAWITANARVRLFDFIYTAGPENVFYGDTDSVTMNKSAVNKIQKFVHNKEYGKFKQEKEWKSFKVIAPKVYTGEIVDKGFSGKVKGIPKKLIEKDNKYFEKMFNSETEDMLKEKVEYNSVPSFMQILKNKKKSANGPLKLQRTISDIRKSLSWVLNADGSVSPIELQLPKSKTLSANDLLNLKLYGEI